MIDKLCYNICKKPQLNLRKITYDKTYDFSTSLSKTILNIINNPKFKAKNEIISNFFIENNIILDISGGEFSFIQCILLALSPDFYELSWSDKKKEITGATGALGDVGTTGAMGDIGTTKEFNNLDEKYRFLKILPENYNYLSFIIKKFNFNIIIIHELEIIHMFYNDVFCDKTIILFEDNIGIFYNVKLCNTNDIPLNFIYLAIKINLIEMATTKEDVKEISAKAPNKEYNKLMRKTVGELKSICHEKFIKIPENKKIFKKDLCDLIINATLV